MVQTNSIKGKIYIIGGPTAVGKSSFAVKCAHFCNGEIVSADSMQIYKKLDIGTAKITEKEKEGIPHHLIDFVEPNEQYSVGKYIVEVKTCINDILSRNKTPIIVGGTGLYINALINGMNLSGDSSNEEVRNKWKDIASKNGKEFVYAHLQKIDPISAEKISPNDLKRVIRAIEIFEVTGKPKSKQAQSFNCEYDYRFTIISDEREKLYERINARVDIMFDNGLIDEVKSLIDYSDCQSMQAIGYKQIIDYFNGKYDTEEDAKNIIKQLSRNYAKRQLTFFKGISASNKNWITPNDFENELIALKEFLR